MHPCDREDNAGCQHLCEKDGPKAVCKCKKNFELEEDGKTCEKGTAMTRWDFSLE